MDIYKAQPIGDQAVPNLLIKAEKTCPEMNLLGQARALYDIQGKRIADALFASLPGCTLDSLLIEMLNRKRSLLKVKF